MSFIISYLTIFQYQWNRGWWAGLSSKSKEITANAILQLRRGLERLLFRCFRDSSVLALGSALFPQTPLSGEMRNLKIRCYDVCPQYHLCPPGRTQIWSPITPSPLRKCPAPGSQEPTRPFTGAQVRGSHLSGTQLEGLCITRKPNCTFHFLQGSPTLWTAVYTTLYSHWSYKKDADQKLRDYPTPPNLE